MAERAVGIDFGTSTTLIATREGEAPPRVIPIGEVTRWMPSILGVDGDRLVAGEPALRLGPRRLLRSIKSLMASGRQFVDVGNEQVSVRDGVRTLLQEALMRAERQSPGLFDGSEIFVGCPALWTGSERRMLVEIFNDCGLTVDIGEVIDEPVAAGLHWVNDQWQRSGERPSGRSLIFDAGGGTLDVAYLDVGGFDEPSMTVLSSEGRPESGDVLDESIANELLGRMAGISNDPLFVTLLREASRDLKESLSTSEFARKTLPAPFGQEVTLERIDLERIFESQLQRALRLTRSAFAGSLLRVAQPLQPSEIRRQLAQWTLLANEVDHIALVGGLAQIPIVRRALKNEFPRSSVTVVDRPQESVAMGLTYGGRLNELNLPRPPVDFCVHFPGQETKVDQAWLETNRLVYGAFSPLYSPESLFQGTGLLGYEKEIPSLPGPRRRYTAVFQCIMPTRNREKLQVRARDSNGEIKKGSGISVDHDGSEPIRFKLYTNGDFVITSHHNTVRARVERWPTLRGSTHDYEREIEVSMPSSSSVSRLDHDDWRFQ